MSDTIYKSTYMNKLFGYIENNMPADLDAALLSSVGCVSYAQLYRDFYNLTGHSVKEYVRKRRLSNALALIKTSDLRLTDIALQCGYSSHQTLCRAVRQSLGLTPSEYKNSGTYYFFPPFNGEPLQSVIVSGETIPRTLRVLFYHSSLINIENMAVRAFLQAFPDYNGRIFGRNGEQAEGKLCYELFLTDTCIDYKKLESYGFEIRHEVFCFNAMFATSTVRNDERKINASWDYLFTEWLQNSMFEYTDEPYYEEYMLKNGRPVKLKLYLPIRKRSDDTRITMMSNPGLHFIISKAKGHNAEKTASQAVIDYLIANYPYVVRTSSEFYLRKELSTYTCGIRVKSDLRINSSENIDSIVTDQDNYLVLESSVIGDYDRYADMLLFFARDTGMTADKNGIFAVYDAKDSYDNPKIKMYCPIKFDTKW